MGGTSVALTASAIWAPYIEITCIIVSICFVISMTECRFSHASEICVPLLLGFTNKTVSSVGIYINLCVLLWMSF